MIPASASRTLPSAACPAGHRARGDGRDAQHARGSSTSAARKLVFVLCGQGIAFANGRPAPTRESKRPLHSAHTRRTLAARAGAHPAAPPGDYLLADRGPLSRRRPGSIVLGRDHSHVCVDRPPACPSVALAASTVTVIYRLHDGCCSLPQRARYASTTRIPANTTTCSSTATRSWRSAPCAGPGPAPRAPRRGAAGAARVEPAMDHVPPPVASSRRSPSRRLLRPPNQPGCPGLAPRAAPNPGLLRVGDAWNRLYADGPGRRSPSLCSDPGPKKNKTVLGPARFCAGGQGGQAVKNSARTPDNADRDILAPPGVEPACAAPPRERADFR